ncbi:MAG: DUF2723 domain-containing protein [Myxococcota bacterium]|nr:DUF2723 domain-containing protein [Myxococcota bacterium]
MTRVLPWAVAALSFALSLLLAAPGLTWLDGGELALAAGSMAVAHPPGEPAYLVLGRLAALLPVGDLPFRLTLLSAGTIALAAGLLSVLVARATGRLRSGPGASVPLAGLVAGLVFLSAPGVQLQAVRPELYGLAILLGLLAAAAIQSGGRRGLALAVLPLCVAGAVHHAMLVAALPGLLLLALGRGRGSLKAGLACSLLLVVPALLQFAWLPLRSLAEPALDFGSPRDLERILWSVSGAAYARSFRPDLPLGLSNLVEHYKLFLEDLGWVALTLSALGLASTWRRYRLAAIGGLLLVLVGILPTALQGVFRADNPDARGYLLGVYAVLASGAGLGAIVVLDRIRRFRPVLASWAGGLLVLSLALPAAAGKLGPADHSGRFLPARLGAELLDAADPGALVLLAGDSWVFPAMYSRYWEGRRPDLELRALHFLDLPVIESLAAKGTTQAISDLTRGLDVSKLPSSSRPEHLAFLLATRAPVGHPVQVNEAFLPGPLAALRGPAGLLYRLGGRGEGRLAKEGWADEDRLWNDRLEALRRDSRYDSDKRGPSMLARRYASRAEYFLSRGESTQALKTYLRGEQLATRPSDPVIVLRYRQEQGDDGPHGPARLQRAAPILDQAEVAFLSGEVDRASELVGGVLHEDPHHPRALIFAERLYSLGRRADAGASP